MLEMLTSDAGILVMSTVGLMLTAVSIVRDTRKLGEDATREELVEFEDVAA